MDSMHIYYRLTIWFLIWLITGLLSGLKAQFIPVGDPFHTLYIEPLRLTDTSNTHSSFNRLPYPGNHSDTSRTPTYGRTIFAKNHAKIKLLPVRWATEFNSHYPFGWNNGSLKKIRGFQQRVSPGLYACWGPLSIQLQPEIIQVNSRAYDWHHDTDNNRFWRRNNFGRLSDRADLPLYNEDSSYYQLFPGQSEISINYFNQSLGLSSKNLSWGPGISQSLTFSNNAPGFLHVFVENNKPIDLKLLKLNYTILGGKLQNTAYDNKIPFIADTSKSINKRQDWRYLSAYQIEIIPTFISHLTLGVIRTVQQYSLTARENREWLPFGVGATRIATQGADERDQQASLYFDWALHPSQLRLYGEIGRNDSPQNLRDIAMSLMHSGAIVTGIEKGFSAFDLLFKFNYEYVRLEKSGTYLLRPEPDWYLNDRIKHGYTQQGEFVGSGLNWGSNAHHFRINYYAKFHQIGISFDQIHNYQDFVNGYNLLAEKRLKLYPWIDFVPGLFATGHVEKLMYQVKTQWVISQNYFWNQSPTISETHWNIPVKHNLFLQLQLSYQL